MEGLFGFDEYTLATGQELREQHARDNLSIFDRVREHERWAIRELQKQGVPDEELPFEGRRTQWPWIDSHLRERFGDEITDAHMAMWVLVHIDELRLYVNGGNIQLAAAVALSLGRHLQRVDFRLLGYEAAVVRGLEHAEVTGPRAAEHRRSDARARYEQEIQTEVAAHPDKADTEVARASMRRADKKLAHSERLAFGTVRRIVPEVRKKLARPSD